MNKAFIIETLKNCQFWEEGSKMLFECGDWELVLRKEESIYSPFTFSLSGNKNGTRETWRRRYMSAEDAFLHVLNGFNENVNIKDKYNTLEEAFKSIE